MGEIRIVGPGKTRGYPYPVCKKEFSSIAKTRTKCVSQVRNIFAKRPRHVVQTFFLALYFLHFKLALLWEMDTFLEETCRSWIYFRFKSALSWQISEGK